MPGPVNALVQFCPHCRTLFLESSPLPVTSVIWWIFSGSSLHSLHLRFCLICQHCPSVSSDVCFSLLPDLQICIPCLWVTYYSCRVLFSSWLLGIALIVEGIDHSCYVFEVGICLSVILALTLNSSLSVGTTVQPVSDVSLAC